MTNHTDQTIIAAIGDANPTRHFGNLGRRIIKLQEELGEHAEAYLNVTSVGNGKGKTWDDVREESADILIVAVDVALTPVGEQAESDTAESLGRRVDIMRYSVPRVFGNYERMTLRVAQHLGTLTKTFMDDAMTWEKAPMAYMVASAMDLAMTPLPDQADWSKQQLIEQLAETVNKKLAKWRNNRDTGVSATDAE